MLQIVSLSRCRTSLIGLSRVALILLHAIESQGRIGLILQIIDEWFGRSLIRSCVKLSYEHAQVFVFTDKLCYYYCYFLLPKSCVICYFLLPISCVINCYFLSLRIETLLARVKIKIRNF